MKRVLLFIFILLSVSYSKPRLLILPIYYANESTILGKHSEDFRKHLVQSGKYDLLGKTEEQEILKSNPQGCPNRDCVDDLLLKEGFDLLIWNKLERENDRFLLSTYVMDREEGSNTYYSESVGNLDSVLVYGIYNNAMQVLGKKVEKEQTANTDENDEDIFMEVSQATPPESHQTNSSTVTLEKPSEKENSSIDKKPSPKKATPTKYTVMDNDDGSSSNNLFTRAGIAFGSISDKQFIVKLSLGMTKYKYSYSLDVHYSLPSANVSFKGAGLAAMYDVIKTDYFLLQGGASLGYWNEELTIKFEDEINEEWSFEEYISNQYFAQGILAVELGKGPLSFHGEVGMFFGISKKWTIAPSITYRF